MKINFYDKIVIVFFLLLALVLFFVFGFSAFGSEGRILRVQCGEKIYAEYNLDTLKEDIMLSLDGKSGGMKLFVSKDNVYVTEAYCEDKLCLDKLISKPGQFIACLPNRILISIVSLNEQSVDVVAY